MRKQRIVLVAGALLAAAFWGAARADEIFDRKTAEADRTIDSISRLTVAVEAQRQDATSKSQAMRASCIEAQLKGARDNLAVARSIRKLWGAGEHDVEYRDRTMTRMLRLQVYAMVFEDEARHCTNAGDVVKSLEVVTKGPTPLSVDPDAPPAPRLERPPLASPY